MNDAINLIHRLDHGRLAQSKKTLKIVKIAAGALLAFLSIVSLVFFILTLQSAFFSLQEQEEELAARILPLQGKAVKVLIVGNRVKDIGSILERRTGFDGAMQAVISAIPPGVNILSFEINNKNVSLVVSASSLRGIDKALDNLMVLAKPNKLFTKVTLEGLTVDIESAEYTVIIRGDFL